jgi:hypothetical protein
VLRPKYQDDQIKEDEIGEECNAHREKRNANKILIGNPEGKRYSEDLGVDGRVILIRISDK